MSSGTCDNPCIDVVALYNGGGGAVSSIFGRSGVVVAVAGDYDASQVDNDSGVAGATVADALDTLDAALAATTSDDVANNSGVAGATVSDALDALAASGGGAVEYLRSCLPGQANSTAGLMQWFGVNSSNPPGTLAQTQTFGGIQNAQVSPMPVQAGSITRATMTLAHAAVAQGSVGASPVMRVNLYREGYSSPRTLLGSVDFPIISAGINNDLSMNNFQTASVDLSGSPIALSDGDLIGCEFQPVFADNEKVSAVGGLYVTLKVEH